jgi:hypothetical protein
MLPGLQARRHLDRPGFFPNPHTKRGVSFGEQLMLPGDGRVVLRHYRQLSIKFLRGSPNLSI